MDYEKRVHAAIRELVRGRLVASAHDISKGGVAVALAECSFGPENIGAAVTFDSDLPPERLLFHEGPSRILVSTDNLERVFRVARENGVHAIEIGATLKARVTISNRDEVLIDDRVDELKGLWNGALEHLLHNSVAV
jgi:phosphoribosylformylglycinamidine synthase